MRGVVYIERENTAGDRRIVRKLDVEGFSVTLGDPMEVIKVAVRDALAEPAVYRVRALHDYLDDKPRTIYSLSVEDIRHA